MSKKVLIQLDTDAQASVFDSIVAIDAEVDHILRHQNVTPNATADLVYGALFTRGPEDLKQTAIFVGGSDVEIADQVFRKVTGCFFEKHRVSVMFDPSGANTTAAAAVLSAGRHVDFPETTALVLAGTGPVGRRVARLLACEGAKVRVGSRALDRAQTVCDVIEASIGGGQLSAHVARSSEGLTAALDGVNLVVAAGPPGVRLLSPEKRRGTGHLEVAIDLNAVPPLGIQGVKTEDRATLRDGTMCYGAIGVGAKKMEIHKTAIRRLFLVSDLVLDLEQIYHLGCDL